MFQLSMTSHLKIKILRNKSLGPAPKIDIDEEIRKSKQKFQSDKQKILNEK